MYLFNRTVRLAGGNTPEAMSWALGITEQVNNLTGLGVRLLQQMYSPGFGTLVWSAFVPDLPTLESAFDKGAADEGYVKAADKGAALIEGGVDDELFAVLHGEPDPARQIQYVTAVRSACANGHVARGIEVGIELAQKAEQITGTPALFLANVTGVYGGVGWATGFEDARALEAGQQALTSDQSWLKAVDKDAGAVYSGEASVTSQVVLRVVV